MRRNLDVLIPIARDLIVADFFTPRGIKVPDVPILIDNDPDVEPFSRFMEGGHSGVDHVTGRYDHIWLNAMLVMDIIGRDDVELVSILAHELAHTALTDADGVDLFFRQGTEVAHGPEFEALIEPMGLLLDPALRGQSTSAGPKFRDWFNRRVVPAYEAARVG